jgi:U3 small nucleolar RNA-associated protein 19
MQVFIFVLLLADRTVIENNEAESDSKESLELSVRKIYQVLSQIPPPEKQAEKSQHEMWSGSDESISEKPTDKKKKTEKGDSTLLSPATISKRMKLKFTKAWISFLRLPLPIDVYKEVLASIHLTVIPHLSNPTMLCDFLTKSYDIGGVVSVMALSSLFILMTQHGLEYPFFYEKLYALLVPSVFVAKHRAKFLQLLDACLKSSMLPAYLAASFTKKLSRLSLSIPPAGSLVITALIYNLLRRNPTINHLVQVRPIFVSAKNILTDENDVCIIPLTTTQNNVYKSMDLQRGHSCSGNR